MNNLTAFYRKTMIKLTIQKNKILGKMGFLPTKSNCATLDTIYKNLTSSNIDIQLYENDKENKDFILDILNILSKYGINVTFTEFNKVFDYNDFIKIREINPNTKTDFRYIYPNYWGASNIGTKIDVDLYVQIQDKIKYLVKTAKSNFTKEDEQIMFIADQLSDYVQYDFDADNKSPQEYLELSSLKGCLQNRKTICAGIALAFERCMNELGIECMLIMGASYNNKDKMSVSSLNNNHVWNKIKLYDEWYNVDVTSILPHPNLDITKEDLVKIFIMSSDSSFEKVGSKITDTTGIPESKLDYPNKIIAYRNTKDIKNVLERYDKGKRTTFISYKNLSSPNYNVKQNVLETSNKNMVKQENPTL